MYIKKYTENDKDIWDDFLKNCKNKHFFFHRDYMEYHKDRFIDFSLMVYDHKDKLIALLPANIDNTTLYTHQGLTFGGFLVDDKMKTEIMLDIFDCLKSFLKENGIKKLVYKCIPYIYHSKPSEEDRYALFINNAVLIRRDITSTIDLSIDIKYSKGRKWTINKAKKNNVCIMKSDNIKGFWEMLENVLSKQHDAKPVHSYNEILDLINKYPDNIKLYLAMQDNLILSGALLYENNNIVHTQYLANSDLGREIGSLDLLIDYLVKNIYSDIKFFDFGISNENQGRVLNTGLIAQKEGFGGRAVAHDFYEMEIN